MDPNRLAHSKQIIHMIGDTKIKTTHTRHDRARCKTIWSNIWYMLPSGLRSVVATGHAKRLIKTRSEQGLGLLKNLRGKIHIGEQKISNLASDCVTPSNAKPCHARRSFNTFRPRQDGRHFQDDVFKWIFLNENVWISVEVLLKFVPMVPINNIVALVQIMAWRRSGDKPLSEPMMANLLSHACDTRPQWVKGQTYWNVVCESCTMLRILVLLVLHMKVEWYWG